MNRDRNLESAEFSLSSQLLAAGLQAIDPQSAEKFAAYLALLLRWNARMNLTSVRSPEEIISRHFVESIACAQGLPPGIETLLDFGSGAGFPGIPIAICRPEIEVALAESQSKKAAFLQEAVRTLQLTSRVFPHRAETLNEKFDCVTLRAVDRMDEAVPFASGLLKVKGCLAVLTSEDELNSVKATAGVDFVWSEPSTLPGSRQRVLALGSKNPSVA